MIDLYYVYAHDQLLYFIKHLVFAMNQIFDDITCSRVQLQVDFVVVYLFAVVRPKTIWR